MLQRWLSRLASNRALHHTRCECSATPLWEPQISQQQRKLLQTCMLLLCMVAKYRPWAIRICSSHVQVVPRSDNSLLQNTYCYSAMILSLDVLHSPVLTESLQTHKQCRDLFPYNYVTPLSADLPDGSFSAGDEINETNGSLQCPHRLRSRLTNSVQVVTAHFLSSSLYHSSSHISLRLLSNVRWPV
jgi:hypothetical protein